MAMAAAAATGPAAEAGEEVQKKVKVESNDGRIFEVPLKVVKLCGTFNNLLEDLGDDVDDDEPLPASNVTGPIMEKVIEWCTHHQDGPEIVDDSMSTEPRCDNIPDWDKKFLDVDLHTFLQILLAANFLNIKGLLLVGGKKMASMMVGKKAEEIREIFHIENDFTPEEEENIRRQNAWAED